MLILLNCPMLLLSVQGGMNALFFIDSHIRRRGEVHNETLAKAAELGIFGLLSIVSVYAIPFIIFMRSVRFRISQEKSAAFMGICLITGFFIFGLTV